MRLIGEFETEKDAIRFSLFLKKESIKNNLDPYKISDTGKVGYRIWVYDEEDFDVAFLFYEKYKQDPEDPIFSIEDVFIQNETSSEEFLTEEKGKVIKLSIRKKFNPFSYWVTYLFFLLCIGLFILNSMEKNRIISEKGLLAAHILLTPSQKILMFDYPSSMKAVERVVDQFPDTDNFNINDLPHNLQVEFKKAEEIPYWKGFYGMRRSIGKNWKEKPWPPMFEKIRQGEYWRFFSPALMHSDLLHIIFNLAWLWILGRQIENRLSKIKMLLLIIFIGSVANISQYLMNGPFFLGFSAIVVGLAGFIWSRQKVAPWEGYPLQKSTLLFILIYVLALFFLEVFSVAVSYFYSYDLMVTIANTAHVVGGVVGLLLGRMKFFARGNN